MSKRDEFSMDKEYQYPEEEVFHVTDDDLAKLAEEPTTVDEKEAEPAVASVQPRAPQSGGGLKDLLAQPGIRRVLGVVVGVILVLIVFHYLKSTRTESTMPSVEQVPSAPVAAQVAPDPMQGVTMANQAVEAVTHSGLFNRGSEERGDNNNAELSALRSELASERASVEHLSQTVLSMKTQLDEAVEHENEMRQAILSLMRKVDTLKSSSAHTTKPTHELTFEVQALLPGRAWVLGSNGQTLSLAIGDMVPGYGYVKVIDTARGVVETTSGKTIGYGQNDH
ncbi:MAG: hypothetical protein A3J38_02905 [Gammaproteobacteria bacterium RIFCSPHIGHO2_12_FULL_45_9]|nr:MAG: hypothetical protein A3J38_02905 [Gammaproteobacteria bacterium RIFCSPHIGHO2_12_FULL_45_9]